VHESAAGSDGGRANPGHGSALPAHTPAAVSDGARGPRDGSASHRGLQPHEAWRRVAVMWSVGAAFVVGSWFGGWRVERRTQWQREPLLSTAVDSVRANYLDSLPEEELIRRAVNGMLAGLGDPYAALLDGDGAASYRGTLQGDGRGVGLTLRPNRDGLLVRRVARGSPAAAAGVRAGDLVVTLDGEPALAAWTVRPAPPPEPAEPSPPPLRLGVQRVGAPDTLALEVARRPWHRPAVGEALRLRDELGYVRLATFARGAADELEAAVATLRDRGVERLVLDLRGNAGGLYDEGVRAAELFLARGQLVASLERRGERGLDPQIARRSRWPDLPLTLVVDRQTASAAELFAAALHDHGRALLVGEPTYGKGAVQRIVPLNGDLALRLTTARWLPPGREPVVRRQEVEGRVTGGLTPDVAIAPAARPDPAAVPSTLSPSDARRVSEAADVVVARARRDGWAGAPVVLLERRARAQLDSLLPAEAWPPVRRRVLLGDGVRVTVRRLLELTRGDEALWQYAAADDPVLRAAEALQAPVASSRGVGGRGGADAPGSAVGLPPSAPGDARAVARLAEWTAARFARRRLDGGPAIERADATARGDAMRAAGRALVIEGRLGRAPDTLVALAFDVVDRLGLPVNRPVRLAEPAGAEAGLTARVVAQLPFRLPRVVDADPARASDWLEASAVLLVVPARTAAAHPGGFAGWGVAADGPVAPRVSAARPVSERSPE
jgi:carboxyl-terminal processing protease